ncbi:hypothetical protein LIER_06067 [Lithospermum erythrorhizon]|uniref:Uncharacterized protein n=1 Tax=Lithospermum erythrorhizon TaxID=34254 RepID=A0AAV3P466_LITER
MTGDRVSLIRRAKIVKKSIKESEAPVEKVAQPSVVVTKKSSTISEKRHALAGEHPRLFSIKRLKSIAHKGSRLCSQGEIRVFNDFLKLPYSLPGSFQVNEESNLWKKSDAFRASCPLLLEWIRKDYDSISDPLNVHGAIACHLIKALNASYALAHVEACEKEKTLQLQIQEHREENERLKASSTLAFKEKKEAAAQNLAKIKKHDLLQSRFTMLEGENFDISNKLQ